MTRVRCENMKCRAAMTERHDQQLGRIVWVCLPCERHAAGLCQDCPALLSSKCARRCLACAKKRNRHLDRERYAAACATEEGRAHVNAVRRKSAAKHREKNRRYCRERYEKSGPRKRDALDLLYHREWNRANRQDPAVRARQSARRRERYAANPEYRAREVEAQRIRRAQQRANATGASA